MKKRHLIIACLCALCLFQSAASQCPGDRVWDKIAFPVISIADSARIEFIARSLLIPLEKGVTAAALVDLNFNGPGARDILIFYPSGDIYFIDAITDTLQKVFLSWPPFEAESLTLSNPQVLDRLDSTQVAYLPLVKALQASVARIYGARPIKLFYSQDDSATIQFEILKATSTAASHAGTAR